MASSSAATATGLGGLTSAQAAESLSRFGQNELATTKRYSLLADLWHSLANPLTIILLMAAAVSAFLGQTADALIIGTMVGLSTIIDLVQTHRSVNAMNKLRAQVSPTATVLRDGDWKEIHRRDLVPDDEIRLSSGDLVPADARLVQARDLYVQQAALTGESLPAEKNVTNDPASTKADAQNMVFLGTSVVSGTGVAEVVNTGARTAFGDIAARLAAKPQETAFS